MNKYYCGIGSRQTPPHILKQMETIAWSLSKCDYILRSGHAVGADQAFGRGAQEAEIWLPWKSFNSAQKVSRHTYKVIDPTDKEAYDSLSFHPNGKNLLASHKLLMARNFRQVIGQNAHNSEFIVCWTSDGKASGGTGQALRIANHYNIPIYNLYDKHDYDELMSFIESLS